MLRFVVMKIGYVSSDFRLLYFEIEVASCFTSSYVGFYLPPVPLWLAKRSPAPPFFHRFFICALYLCTYVRRRADGLNSSRHAYDKLACAWVGVKFEDASRSKLRSVWICTTPRHQAEARTESVAVVEVLPDTVPKAQKKEERASKQSVWVEAEQCTTCTQLWCR